MSDKVEKRADNCWHRQSMNLMRLSLLREALETTPNRTHSGGFVCTKLIEDPEQRDVTCVGPDHRECPGWEYMWG